MPPVAIEIMLHYHCTSARDYRHGDFSAPAVREFIRTFVDAGLLEHIKSDTSNPKPRYQITEGGRLYVQELENVPLPVRRMCWVHPEPIRREEWTVGTEVMQRICDTLDAQVRS